MHVHVASVKKSSTPLHHPRIKLLPRSALGNPRLHLLSMQPILQMNFEVIDSHLRPGRIQFARAVLAFDPRVEHVLDVILRLVFGKSDGLIGRQADRRVSHRAFECVIRVVLLQALESGREPRRRRRLQNCGGQSMMDMFRSTHVIAARNGTERRTVIVKGALSTSDACSRPSRQTVVPVRAQWAGGTRCEDQ